MLITAGLTGRSSALGLIALAMGVLALTLSDEAVAQTQPAAFRDNILAGRFIVSSEEGGQCRPGVSGPYTTHVGSDGRFEALCKRAIGAAALRDGASFHAIWSPFILAGIGSAAGGPPAEGFIAEMNAVDLVETPHVVQDVVQFDHIRYNGQDVTQALVHDVMNNSVWVQNLDGPGGYTILFFADPQFGNPWVVSASGVPRNILGAQMFAIQAPSGEEACGVIAYNAPGTTEPVQMDDRFSIFVGGNPGDTIEYEAGGVLAADPWLAPPFCHAVAINGSTWGAIKSLYRP